jgi:hypothetical protein
VQPPGDGCTAARAPHTKARALRAAARNELCTGSGVTRLTASSNGNHTAWSCSGESVTARVEEGAWARKHGQSGLCGGDRGSSGRQGAGSLAAAALALAPWRRKRRAGAGAVQVQAPEPAPEAPEQDPAGGDRP